MILPGYRRAAANPRSSTLRVFATPRLTRFGLAYGRGQVSGTVKVKGTPNQAKRAIVLLLDKQDRSRVLAETISNEITGGYVFNDVDHTRTYLVLAIDPLTLYTAVVADNVVPQVLG